MATQTPNLGLNKPEVGGDVDQWGYLLNDNFDILDEEVYSRSKVYTGDTPPSNPKKGDIWVDNAGNAYIYTTDWKLATGGGAGAEVYDHTRVVSASNSVEARGHYRCDGTDDQVEINQAISDIVT